MDLCVMVMGLVPHETSPAPRPLAWTRGSGCLRESLTQINALHISAALLGNI
jgi:hypothetical protein